MLSGLRQLGEGPRAMKARDGRPRATPAAQGRRRQYGSERERAARSHQNPQPSEAIRSHHKPSEAARSHPQPSEAIRSHPQPSAAIRSHPQPSEAIRGAHRLLVSCSDGPVLIDAAKMERNSADEPTRGGTGSPSWLGLVDEGGCHDGARRCPRALGEVPSSAAPEEGVHVDVRRWRFELPSLAR